MIWSEDSPRKKLYEEHTITANDHENANAMKTTLMSKTQRNCPTLSTTAGGEISNTYSAPNLYSGSFPSATPPAMAGPGNPTLNGSKFEIKSADNENHNGARKSVGSTTLDTAQGTSHPRTHRNKLIPAITEIATTSPARNGTLPTVSMTIGRDITSRPPPG